MPRNLNQSVVVITGASSGFGRATALAFAARGCRVVLAARRAQALEDVAQECRSRGGDGLAIPTDVASPEDVEALACAAVERFGRMDVWSTWRRSSPMSASPAPAPT